ncbi:hypothetical protein RRG08_038672 [Elysia crispata]|uniref:Uncharacterized protein n=1 Tax=Elysia crispata TaxID=231223 RepID=A0AAE1DHN3_9GAST|nr:hypothetical protein RRG08_038672 [Elysia crispata]
MSGISFITRAFRSDSTDSALSSRGGVELSNPPYLNGFSTRRRDLSTQTDQPSKDLADSGRTTRCGCLPGKDGQRDQNGRGIVHHYVESATIHGIGQAGGPQHYRFRRPLWLLLVLGMAVGLGTTLFNQVSSYYDYPIRTVTKVEINSELAFPAVTICNLNQFVRERVPDIPIVNLVFFYLSDYAQLSRKLNSMPDLDNLTDVSGEELNRIALHAAPRLNDLLRQCRWTRRLYKCEDMFKPINTSYGLCFVFNGPQRRPEDRVHSSGTWSSLRVLAYTQNNKSYFSRLIHAGVKVMVHEPDHLPHPEDEGWFLRPGVSANLALTRTDSLNLARPYKAYSNGYCEDTKAEGYVNRLKDFQVYSEVNCFHECVRDFLDRICGCQIFLFSGNRTICSAKKVLTCLMPALGTYSVEEMRLCNCDKECESVTYDGEVSYADFASAFIEEQAEQDSIILSHDDLRKNIVDVRVWYKTMNVFQVTQEPKLTRNSILATLGGQMGLFLGASILSITELLEVVLVLTFNRLKRCVSGLYRLC